MIEIKVQDIDVKKISKRLKGMESKAPYVLVNAINRAITNVKSNMVKKASEKYLVKPKDVREAIPKPQKAKITNLTGYINSVGYKIALNKFKVSPNKPTSIKSRPEYHVAQVLKNGSTKNLSGDDKQSKGFVVKFASGHVGVYERLKGKKTKKGKGLEELIPLYGPSIPEMLGTKDINKYIIDEAQKTIKKRIDHEINRILQNG